MSIELALSELKTVLEPYLCGMIGRDLDFEELPTRRKTPNIFINDLRPPAINETEDEYERDVYPFVLLTAPTGTASMGEGESGENEIPVVAVIGVCDPVEDKQGIAGVHNIIDRIIAAVQENPHTTHCTLDRNLPWMADDDESVYPYYYGSVTITVRDRLTTPAEYDI